MKLLGFRCPIIIAEAGNNHEGSLDAALELIDRAKEAGADLVKFQAGTAEGFARSPDDVERYRKYEFGVGDYRRLVDRGAELGIPVFFSVWGEGFENFRKLSFSKIPARQFSEESVGKWATETTFISVPSTVKDYEWLKYYPGIPLHCVSEYPAKDPALHLLLRLKRLLQRPVGYSDHTIGIENALMAVRFGAVAIEKHFTLAHDFGPLRDHQLSATPAEMAELVKRAKA